MYKHSDVKVILPRHEQALVHKADAYARTTGKVGVCLVTSGPCATNLVTGLATDVLEELPIIACIFNNEYLGMVRQWQKLFYGKRSSMTNLKAGALSRRTEGREFPEYTPDFIKLVESYGTKGIRVTKREEIAPAFEEAKKIPKCPPLLSLSWPLKKWSTL